MKHKKYEIVESKRNIWSLSYKFHQQSGRKWKLHACLRKKNGFFKITQYVSPHRCVYLRLSHNYPQLDSNLLLLEIKSQVKAEPLITIATLRESVEAKFHYTISHKKM